MNSNCVKSLHSLPHLSVIIPIYNGEADLPDLLHCLQQQDYPLDRVDYWLVDNNSSDRTPDLLQALPPSGNWHRLQESTIQSSYAARNTGIRAAQADILVFTDADCRPCANWLRYLVEPFEHPTVGLVAGEIVALPGHTVLERYADRQATLSQKHTLAHSFLPYGQTANLAVRRSILEQVGLFRPYLTTGGDADLCWRILQQTPYTIHFAEQAIVQHRHRQTLTELRSQWQRYGRSNRFLQELHGIHLTRELCFQDQLRRWSRWLLKEVPTAFIKVNSRKAGTSSWIDAMVETPLNLFCQQARAQGQRQAQLTSAAQEIAWLSPSTPPVSSAASLLQL